MKQKHFCLFLLVSVLMLAGCTKEDNGNQGANRKYTVTYNGHYSSATINIFEYDSNGDPIYHVGGKFYQGRSKEFTAQSSTAKIKLNVELPFDMGWVRTAYPISSSPLSIVIDDNTVLGAEPY